MRSGIPNNPYIIAKNVPFTPWGVFCVFWRAGKSFHITKKYPSVGTRRAVSGDSARAKEYRQLLWLIERIEDAVKSVHFIRASGHGTPCPYKRVQKLRSVGAAFRGNGSEILLLLCQTCNFRCPLANSADSWYTDNNLRTERTVS